MWGPLLSFAIQQALGRTVFAPEKDYSQYASDPTSPESLAAANDKSRTTFETQIAGGNKFATSGGQQFNTGIAPSANMLNSQLALYGRYDTMAPGWEELIKKVEKMLAGATDGDLSWGGTGEGSDTQSSNTDSNTSGSADSGDSPR